MRTLVLGSVLLLGVWSSRAYSDQSFRWQLSDCATLVTTHSKEINLSVRPNPQATNGTYELTLKEAGSTSVIEFTVQGASGRWGTPQRLSTSMEVSKDFARWTATRNPEYRAENALRKITFEVDSLQRGILTLVYLDATNERLGVEGVIGAVFAVKTSRTLFVKQYRTDGSYAEWTLEVPIKGNGFDPEPPWTQKVYAVCREGLGLRAHFGVSGGKPEAQKISTETEKKLIEPYLPQLW